MSLDRIEKIGIMSDSHDNLPAIRAAVDLFNRERVEFVIHAGDLVAPFTAREMKKLNCPFEIVLGNNDGEILGLHRVYQGHVHQPPLELKLGGIKILVLHDGSFLRHIEEIRDFDVIIYGHDHEGKIAKTNNGTLLINPGETGGWLHGKSTVCIFDVSQNNASLYELNISLITEK
ncbi:MAG: metallophosphoesterase [Calditrichaeota bacterium]|nr:metallophosphoesterase [Calditrichota bacterium]